MMLITGTWTAVKCTSLFVVIAPLKVRGAWNSAVDNFSLRLKLNQTDRAGSNNVCLDGDTPHIDPARQHAWTPQWEHPVHGIMQLSGVFKNLNYTQESEMCVGNAA